jgi:hypothetical protein
MAFSASSASARSFLGEESRNRTTFPRTCQRGSLRLPFDRQIENGAEARAFMDQMIQADNMRDLVVIVIAAA